MAGKKGQKIKKPKELSERFPEYYKIRNPKWTDEQCIEASRKFKRSCNYQCIEYYEKKYPDLTHEEHVKLKADLQIQKKGNNPLNLEYYKLRYPELNADEQEMKWHEYVKTQNFLCIEFYNLRYPDKTQDERNQMLTDAIKNYTAKIDLRGANNGMHHSKISVLKRRQTSPRCIEFYETKYPDLTHEEHVRLRDDFFEKTKQSIKNAVKDTNIEYYLNKGMSIDEAKQALHDRQSTFSLEKCIEKYGETDGKIKYQKSQQQWLKKLQENFKINGDGRSKQSVFAKDIIRACCKYLNINIPKKEKYINDTTNIYAYDFTFGDKIIEFNEDYWHCNPKLYDETFYNKVKQKTAKEIWDYDLNKKLTAEKYGYKVLYVWEYDYNNNKQQEIQRCINFLTNEKDN